jgi:hypothetical protein
MAAFQKCPENREAISAKANVSAANVKALRAGRSQNKGIETLEQLSEVCGLVFQKCPENREAISAEANVSEANVKARRAGRSQNKGIGTLRY